LCAGSLFLTTPLFVNERVEENKQTETLVLANTIITKKIKVPSPTVFAIKKKMHELINCIKDKPKTLKERQDNVLSEESIETVLPP
jgi:hypothetical protein